MKKLFLSLVFILVASFSFASTSNCETLKTENSVSINLDNQLMRKMPLIVGTSCGTVLVFEIEDDMSTDAIFDLVDAVDLLFCGLTFP
jgi:hypothetical protein